MVLVPRVNHPSDIPCLPFQAVQQTVHGNISFLVGPKLLLYCRNPRKQSHPPGQSNTRVCISVTSQHAFFRGEVFAAEACEVVQQRTDLLWVPVAQDRVLNAVHCSQEDIPHARLFDGPGYSL